MRVHLVAAFWLTFLFQGSAHEGMWLPTLLQSIESDLQSAGLQISAEDIYSLNQGSIKDAVVLFGGGCTAEIISDQGLILTNHHCGFSAVQQHSSLEHDYLKDGFWAATRQDELRNPSLSATFIIRMEDVTARVLAAIRSGSTEQERREAVMKAGEEIVKEAVQGTHYNGAVRPFNYGNSYYLIVTETFRDVRLVGAPPGAVGKFGGDTDNWMWPRHTGDFSLFRIYAGPDNAPADPADANVPFVPRHVLPVSMDGVHEGDFAMIFGFPGSTQRYLTSPAVEHLVSTQDPLRIRMRSASLAVIDAAMRSSDRTRIQYAAKQSSISNSYKKWIGEVRGLKELNAVERKRAFEVDYQHRADSAGIDAYQQVLAALKGTYAEWIPLAIARDLFSEFIFAGPEILRFADRFKELAVNREQLEAAGKLDEEVARLRRGAQEFFQDYDPEVDRRVFKALLPIYREHADAALVPAALAVIDQRWNGDVGRYADDLYARSLFTSEPRVMDLLEKFNAKAAKTLARDPAFTLSQDFMASYNERIKPPLASLNDRIESGMRTYVQGLMALFPERTYWPDANSTLRLSYGRVEGSRPRDAVDYEAFSSLDGVIEKYVPGDPEFDLPPRLVEIHHSGDFGPYGDGGRMPVCFTASLHTTGGNSGSPILNARGELIGLNFDRSWESTMSDVLFDPAKCRNIAVDIRYVLFIIDKLCGAGHLVEEMELVRHARPEMTTEPNIPH